MSEEKNLGDPHSLSESLAEALPRLTPAQLEQVSPKFRRLTYAPGEVIVRQGDPPDRFYIMVRGRALVYHRTPDGRDQVVDERTPGHYFGEIGLLKDQPRTATVQAAAEGEVEVLALEREDFLALVRASRGTASQVTQDLIRRMINLAHHQT